MTFARKEQPRFTIDPDAKFGTRLRDHVAFQEPTKSGPGPIWTGLAYIGLMVGVGAAAFILTTTPAPAAGSMGIDVKVIHVSPSITSFEDTREGRKLQADVTRDRYRHQQDMELEDRKAEHRRALEADRAYYKKLEFQRKKHGF